MAATGTLGWRNKLTPWASGAAVVCWASLTGIQLAAGDQVRGSISMICALLLGASFIGNLVKRRSSWTDHQRRSVVVEWLLDLVATRKSRRDPGPELRKQQQPDEPELSGIAERLGTTDRQDRPPT